MSKTLRYYYWLLIEFTKRHLKMILLSFFLSFFIVVTLISFSPILNRFLFSQREIIGIVGDYNINNLPDEIVENISHGLVFINDKGQLVPALASKWQIIRGGEEFTFDLKKGLTWDDGNAFTTKDINYNFKDVKVNIVDNDTINFKLDKKLPIFPTYLTKPITKYPLRGVAGLYKVDKMRTSQGLVREVHLSPNKKDLPLLVYKFYDTESHLINAYKSGEINKFTIHKNNVAESFSNWKNTKIAKSVDYTRVMTLFFNLKNQILAEKEVREAIAQSIPRKEIVKLGEVAVGPIPPTSWAYNPTVQITFENLALSKNSLNKYFTATSSANLKFETFYDYLGVATALDENFKKVDLPTSVKLTDFESPGQFDMLLAFWRIPDDPDQYFIWHSTQTQGNITGYRNVRIDKLLEDGRSTLRPDERKQHYMQFQRIIADDLPAIFLYHPYVYTIQRK